MSGGTAEVLEDEKALQSYAWPDKKVNTHIVICKFNFCIQYGSISLWTSLIRGKLFLQKPRICILGGGFGGLYTALRLESLEWPDDKKPQVRFLNNAVLVFSRMIM